MKNFFKKIGNFFKKCFLSVKKFVLKVTSKVAHSKLYCLVMMQLKDKWNMSFKHDKKGTLLRLSGKLIVFVVITVICYFIMSLTTGTLHIFFSSRIPLAAMIPVIFVLTIFEVLSILIGMTKSLYFAKDNVVLITYPVKSDYLFLSKIIVYYVDAIKKSFMLFFPVIISFGLIYGYPFHFYLWALFIDFFYVGLITLFCGLLSVPTYFVLKFLNKFRVIKVFLTLVLAGALIYGTVLLINVIPSNINLVREYDKFTKGLNDFLLWFSDSFKFSNAVTHTFLGTRDGYAMKIYSTYTWAGLLVSIGGIAVLVVANAFLAKPFYNKMIATTNRSSARQPREHKNIRLPKHLSVLCYELLRVVRNERYLVSTLTCITVMPLITLVVNRLYDAFNTDSTGMFLMFVFNFFFILIVVCSHNTSAATVFSKDGPSWTVNKTMPVNPRISLSLRLVYNIFMSLLIIIPSSILFFNWFKGSERYSLFLFIITLFILGVFHNVISASFDYSHSENKDKADIGSEIVSSHELVSIAFGFLIGLVYIGIMLIFFITATNKVQERLLIAALLALVIGVFSFLRKVRLTYQEN